VPRALKTDEEKQPQWQKFLADAELSKAKDAKEAEERC